MEGEEEFASGGEVAAAAEYLEQLEMDSIVEWEMETVAEKVEEMESGGRGFDYVE